jgi:hypothetical protein
MLAGLGLASLSTCQRWLPSWLPAIRPTSIQMRQSAGPVRSSGASASLASCDTWATKLVTIRDPGGQPPAGDRAYL